MLQTRIIPALLLKDDALVKTTKFKNAKYIGDPVNTVRIFNELEVDELVFLDITATKENRIPNLKLLEEVANECFMPLGYGGGLNDFEVIKSIFGIGFEKVVLNTITNIKPTFVTKIADHFGNQAVMVSIDVKKNLWGNYEVWSNGGTINTKKNPIEWAIEMEKLGAGEILLTSIDKEGTWSGFDIELVKRVNEAVNIPVIAHGGAGKLQHIGDVIKNGKVSAVALGSLVVYQQKGMGVLVNFPDFNELQSVIGK